MRDRRKRVLDDRPVRVAQAGEAGGSPNRVVDEDHAIHAAKRAPVEEPVGQRGIVPGIVPEPRLGVERREMRRDIPGDAAAEDPMARMDAPDVGTRRSPLPALWRARIVAEPAWLADLQGL
jgi:hypothetical protein